MFDLTDFLSLQFTLVPLASNSAQDEDSAREKAASKANNKSLTKVFVLPYDYLPSSYRQPGLDCISS